MTGKQRFFTILGMIVGAFLLFMSFSAYFPEKNYAYAFGCLGAGLVLIALMIFIQYRLREKYGKDTVIGWIIEKVKDGREKKRREEVRRAAEERAAAQKAEEQARAEEAARLREEQEAARKAEEQARAEERVAARKAEEQARAEEAVERARQAEIDRKNTVSLFIEVQNVQGRNASGRQPQTVLRRCYEKQEKGTYEDNGASFEPYKLPDGGWTYAVIIDGTKVGNTTPEIAEQLADLANRGARNTYHLNIFGAKVDPETGEQYYTCTIAVNYLVPDNAQA